MIRFYPITPTPAPRQNRGDAWKPSAPVLRYRAFRDEVALRRVTVPDAGAHVLYLFAVPRSLSNRERTARLYGPHQQKPDKDNLEKGLIDAVYRDKDDARVWDLRGSKVWAPVAGIVIADHMLDVSPDALRVLLGPLAGFM